MLVPVYILFIGLLFLAQLMQSYASCFLPSFLRSCTCLLFLYRSLQVSAISLYHLVHCLGFCSLFYTEHILQSMLGQLVCDVYAGIACLAFLSYDWSQLHVGIACLASLAYDWVTACWDSLSILLHTGIVCLASLAYDWVTVCWDSLSAHSMLGKHV